MTVGVETIAEIAREAQALGHHPMFEAALYEYTGDLIRFRKSQRHFNKIISQQFRFRVIGHLLHLHGQRYGAAAGGGATYTELAQACANFNSSPRHLKTMLGLMQIMGLVSKMPDTQDRRRKFYVPTPRLLAFVRRRVMCAAVSLDILHPRARYSQTLLDDEDMVVRVWATGGEEFALGPAMAEAMPQFHPFFRGREGAAPLIFAIMHADFRNVPCPSRSAIAAQFGLSKTQTTHLISEAVELGLVALTDTGAPCATDLLRDNYRRLVAFELAFFARHIRPPA
ncbi:hypothetical protein [Asticcacaulis machinosus]|uniref:MarR family transcriptional regulator n=1 Tax=Asticcacaulis machinosus TaxID=2984211 RepID=A0ABT5HGN0_9CAUL|nr:hypothetical protein [Asticcacaulis machinosus]MDC7675420.1 hypothetical protein [Asticcacaulis machinosus]